MVSVDVAGRVRAQQIPADQSTAVDEEVRTHVRGGKANDAIKRSRELRRAPTSQTLRTRQVSASSGRRCMSPDLQHAIVAIGVSGVADQYPAAASGDPSRL
jgi:hypothetical protein